MKNAVLSSLTVGEIAARCRCSIHQVEYVIRSRGLQPAARAGRIRIFSAEDLDFIAKTIQEIARRAANLRTAPSGTGPTAAGALGEEVLPLE